LALGESALDHMRRNLGVEHPESAMAATVVADIYEALGRAQAARSLRASAFPTLERSLGSQHPKTRQLAQALAR